MLRAVAFVQAPSSRWQVHAPSFARCVTQFRPIAGSRRGHVTWPGSMLSWHVSHRGLRSS
eukprot:scaffold3630_cov306-Prasinococcus_capsulatus_cf.AAC.5